MAITLDIGLQTLTVGSHTFGPITVPDELMLATLTIDRTVSRANVQGLNGQPDTTRVDIAIEESDDGGLSWGLRAAAGLIGGLYPSAPDGPPYSFSNVQVELNPTIGRRARAIVTVAGARVAVAGSLEVV
jgi:hypothetical protein